MTLQESLRFDGDTYEPEHDQERLGTQLERVRGYMLCGRWATLSEISAVCGGSVASVSARLRDLRKERFGSWTVIRRPRGERKLGVFEYRVWREVAP